MALGLYFPFSYSCPPPSERKVHHRYAFSTSPKALHSHQWRSNATPTSTSRSDYPGKQVRITEEDSTVRDSFTEEADEEEEDEEDSWGESESESESESSEGELTSSEEVSDDSQVRSESRKVYAVARDDSQPVERARRIDELCAKVREREDLRVTAGELISTFTFRLDKFQRLAIEAFLKGSSVVVSAPTSSGKTLIAEAAATATLARCKRLYYTTPLKALSNQKFREFRSIFGEASVGLITGDVSFNREAPIVIMTAEILRNKFYLSAGNDNMLENVEAVVLDEIHYIGDLTRGTVWEETVIYCPKGIQLICLSATVSNPDELAGWIAKVHGPTELITSSKRPVPLTWHVSRRSDMLPLLNERGTRMNRKLVVSPRQLAEFYGQSNKGRTNWYEETDQLQLLRRYQVPRLKDTLRQLVERNMLPAIWFILSRRRCDEAVQVLQDANLLTKEEFEQVDMALKAFREQYPDAVRESGVQPLYQGVAAHHAGCLPLWKSFIEELFQKGLVKAVFATETLAAGINMPARTTVLSGFDMKGPRKLGSNAILQMAGRAGRRGIDVEGHVVMLQTPFRGPEECYKMMHKGSEPVMSQFTATYGMVLNLLEEDFTADKPTGDGKSLGEARSLIEQSFGNYLGSEILLGSKAKIFQLKEEIDSLESGQSKDSMSKLFEERITEFHTLRDKVEIKERKERALRFKVERLRSSVMQKQVKKLLPAELPYVCATYVDVKTGRELTITAVVADVRTTNPFSLALNQGDITEKESIEAPYLALGADNFWYRFPAKVIERVYRGDSGVEHQTAIKSQLTDVTDVAWEVAGEENVYRSVTPCVNVDVPSLNKAAAQCEVPEELCAAEKMLADQQRTLGKWSRKLAEIDGREIENLKVKVKQMRKEKIERLKAKMERIENRIKQMQPSGWKEFLQVVNVLKASGAMKPESYELLPLGEIARALRGSNELWLAIALQDPGLTSLRPSELAAVASSLVNEKSKLELSSETYQPSSVLMEWAERLELRRMSLLQVQQEHGLEFPCELDPQLAGFVEAWASGVNWKELDISYVVDEGDFARLLRRTIDLLSQIPHLPHLDPSLAKIAKEAARNMDRPPISEPVAV